ncbi:MAG: DUF554 domain-containing protein [Alloprevotella sp.]|nr:DUF554 domain-containing protein [Alloprevotella sp.]
MLAILINALSIIAGSLVGAITKRGINAKYLSTLTTAMGIAVLVLGINVAMPNMVKSQVPVLFIFCLAVGGLIGTFLRLDERMEGVSRRMERHTPKKAGTPPLSEGITTATLLCCVGTLAIMGPILSALQGDNTYLMTAATLNFVTLIVVASTYGFGVALSAIPVFLWMSFFFLLGKLSAGFVTTEPGSLSAEIITETNIVGGVLIAAAGLGVLHIKDCKTINLLPALFLPCLYFAVRWVLGI